MLIHWIKKRLLRPREVTGIEAHFEETSNIQFRSITIGTTNGHIFKKSVTHSLNELKTPDPFKNTLVCTGKGILIKQTEARNPIENPVQAIFPQARSEEFYAQVTYSQNCAFIVLARKKQIDDLIIFLEQKGIYVLDVHLGFPIMETIASHVDDDRVELTDISLELKDGSINRFHSLDINDHNIQKEYLVSGLYLQDSHLLSFATAVHLLAHSEEGIRSSETDIIKHNWKNYRYRTYFKATALGLLFLSFIVLLLNFFIHQHFKNKNQEIMLQKSAESEFNQRSNAAIDSIEMKKMFFDISGWTEMNNTSYIADRFASLLPKNIWLSEMNIYPDNKADEFKNANGIRFQKDKVRITAYSSEASSIKVFIENLKLLKCVHSVEMKNYTFDKENEVGKFTLEIIIQ